ncbi:hypothetical protein [Photobacterium damselae]|uniref:Uncharacterized protein n=1 Tax=Photobacterium damselae subsp. damselae TaxID=85581 RepID=A0AAD3WWD6_PHODD|nr:hypothetical protein [Photobacterium damselae]KAB1178931.1 hypothetical protein F6450_14650 [Photobacterium damselae subsp. damselae]
MNISPSKIWSPKEWEIHANKLLRIRYRHLKEDYIPIPDQDRGDGGIEGFSLDGYAYQMYCPQDVTTISSLYEKQRTKMTDDIKKFISNKKKMKGFFGDLKIKRWVLVVPEHKTKDLVTHATKKTSEVKIENLEYVDSENFRVLIWDLEEFKREEAELLSSGLAVLKLDPIDVSSSHIEGYQSEAPEFSENITRKLSKLSSNVSVINRGKDTLTKNAIISQNMMCELKQEYGEYYEQINTTAVNRAEQLDIEALDASPETQKINYQISTLKQQLQKNCKLHTDNLDTISTGIVADWLMNCTLDFE